MAKSKSKKRKQAAQVDIPHKVLKAAATLSPPPTDGDSDGAALEPKSLQTVVSDEELDITIDSLNALAQYPNLLKSKACKDLRVAVYEFRQACTTGVNNAGANLTGRITAALADGKYTEARILLAEMKIRGEEPKLGALCRWVRDLDVISGLSTLPDAGAGVPVDRSEHDKELLSVLDAVLRVSGPIDSNSNAVPVTSSPGIALQSIWDLRPSAPPQKTYASVLDKSIFASPSSSPASIASTLRVIETTPGPLRKPPNHHPAVLYAFSPETAPLSPTPQAVTYTAHPTVPGLSLATNVLSPAECRAIIAAGEAVTFLPDAPLREDGDVSVLAHNFYCVVDGAFHDTLWARIAPLLPPSLDGRRARGLNRRFRVYRYVPGAEYRAHIDGAWPPSGIRPDDTYVYDASPEGAKQSSLFTFLIYLNDEFEGGETTFFVPAVGEGVLNAYPVRPVMGGVAVFPHGDARGALLHEGTGVRKGAKYVIRTEVEFDVEAGVVA
ncbi:prolyl 4-hydroxylase [Podospora appendiculata]|uniref:Prolyl 4-hydroxylase n=1 Tax=Podospora appendiculata TaxID=314037 RepID=A0AAE1CDG6_9PEZI|nr:prolyl 4-hydroxylase [Podospora appendiculata]